jgi:hypothetical protein
LQILSLAALLLVTAGVYARGLHGDFQFDDISSVIYDPAAHNLTAVTRWLLPSLLSARNFLATATVAEGRPGKTRSAGLEGGQGHAAFEQAVQLQNDEQGSLLLARAYRAHGRVREACAVIQQVSRPSTELKDQIDEAAKGCPAH